MPERNVDQQAAEQSPALVLEPWKPEDKVLAEPVHERPAEQALAITDFRDHALKLEASGGIVRLG